MFALINTADQSIHANAQMYLSGTNEYMGEVNFYMEEQPFGVVISGSVNRLRPSSVLGFHIHSKPIDDSHNCTAGGAHFNPYNVSHGMPRDPITQRHIGDLGNIQTDETGRAYVGLVDHYMSLGTYNNLTNVLGLPLMIHNLTDDGGHTGKGQSNTTGNAGTSIACGTIRLG
ncbi:unnamed protein product [Adineta ricciae]|uniref:Superoxide dismutase copper/zinc binding domain-containing protein n=1 Tax=Adineta ricciae TaxID=249248 RepID=A0A814HYI9_ADIRI|nr:unnamed protein product [Adineta ricciae]CAF1027445.1 unnamed protein product [Adineta ricciae]